MTARTITRGSGNVFTDLGLPQAKELHTKTKLAVSLNRLLDSHGLTQAAAAKLLGLPQPKISALRRYKLDGLSVEKLMVLLTALDRDVDIVIRPKPNSRPQARIAVRAA